MSKGCKPISIVAIDPEDNIVGAITGTMFIDAGVIMGKLVSHVSCRGGPLFTQTTDGMNVGHTLLLEFLKNSRQQSLYTRVYPVFAYDDQIMLLSRLGFSKEEWLNYTIDLTKGEQAVLDGMSKHRRKGIRRVEQIGLEMVDVKTRQDLNAMYELLVESHKAAKIPIQDKSLFEALQSIMVPKGQARMVVAYRREDPIAARVVLIFSDVIYDWYAGSTESKELSNANEFLVWKLLSWGCRSGFRTFDFGGAGKPDEEYGPREFKRRFGGEQTNLGRYTIVHKPKVLKLVEDLYKIRRRI